MAIFPFTCEHCGAALQAHVEPVEHSVWSTEGDLSQVRHLQGSFPPNVVEVAENDPLPSQLGRGADRI